MHIMKTYFATIIFFSLFSISSAQATYKNAWDINSLAKCSAYMNNLNHKYGMQLLDNGYTHQTVFDDELYLKTSIYQLYFMAATIIRDKWEIYSFEAFENEMERSKIFDRVHKYDTQKMQNMKISKLLSEAFSPFCREQFVQYFEYNKRPEKFKQILDKIGPYLERNRGF